MKGYRSEQKHYINYGEYMALRPRLRAVMQPDIHGDADHRYLVRTLYLDTAEDRALQEKLDGLNHRDKFRIRYYNMDSSFIQLEKKSKMEGLCKKEQAVITKEECEALLQGDISCLRCSHEPLLMELYIKWQSQQLRPKNIVDYRREAYIYPHGNVRVTIDTEIRTGLHQTDLFSNDLVMVKLSDLLVLEVKFDAYLPGMIQDVIQIGNRRNSAISKYAASRLLGY